MKVKKCEIVKDGRLNLTIEDTVRGRIYELYNVEMDITEVAMHSNWFGESSTEVNGSFISTSKFNNEYDSPPLEVTISDIEEKFGRKVKIVGDT